MAYLPPGSVLYIYVEPGRCKGNNFYNTRKSTFACVYTVKVHKVGTTYFSH